MSAHTSFDAIVVGSGITGGLAAKELTEKGLKVLLLERGRTIEPGLDYQGEHMAPWNIPFGGKPLRDLYQSDYAIQHDCYAFNETTRQFWNNDRLNPYIYDDNKPFKWRRSDVVGGRSLLWGRQSYRWNRWDFEANKKDGHGIDWPIRYDDLAPWYSQVENYIGVSGQRENWPTLPDSDFLTPMSLNVVEQRMKQKIEAQYPGRLLTIGRTATLTEPQGIRGACHYCGPCERGCAVGAYFCSLSSTLPAARKTGNLTLLADSVVHSIEYSPETQRATGVRVIDANTFEKTTYRAKLIFLNASTVGSAQILLNSRSEAFPNGLANSSGALGHYLMDHAIGPGAMGFMPGFDEFVEYGNRPTGSYIPRFRNIGNAEDSDAFSRGYGYQVYAGRLDWRRMQPTEKGFGEAFKNRLIQPGPWHMFILGYAECLPRYDNYMALDSKLVDRFGIPQVRFNFSFGDNEKAMFKDMSSQAADMLRVAGGVEVQEHATVGAPGDAIHEMGTARMGDDPGQSVLNGHNQCHDVPNVFITDGSCMSSSSCVNPSLTYMALTVRATDFAVKQLQQGKL